MGLVIAGLQRLQSLTGGLVLGVHHMGKDTTRGARGHSSLYAACDVVLAVTAGPQGHSVNTATGDGGKSKDAEPISHAFDLTRVVLRTLDDGAEISGVCVEPQEAAPRPTLPKKPRGKNMCIVWDRLGAMLREAGDIRPAQAPATLPQGRPAVRLEDAMKVIDPHMPTEQKHRAQRISEAITGLVAGGWLEHMDGWLWAR
jgi:hypothetical protein